EIALVEVRLRLSDQRTFACPRNVGCEEDGGGRSTVLYEAAGCSSQAVSQLRAVRITCDPGSVGDALKDSCFPLLDAPSPAHLDVRLETNRWQKDAESLGGVGRRSPAIQFRPACLLRRIGFDIVGLGACAYLNIQRSFKRECSALLS